MYNLANVLRDQRRFADAETLYRDTLESELRTLGEEHPETADTTFQLACVVALRGAREESLRLLRSATERGLTEADWSIEPVCDVPAFSKVLDAVRSAPR